MKIVLYQNNIGLFSNKFWREMRFHSLTFKFVMCYFCKYQYDLSNCNIADNPWDCKHITFSWIF
jgi:hypothetical protein